MKIAAKYDAKIRKQYSLFTAIQHGVSRSSFLYTENIMTLNVDSEYSLLIWRSLSLSKENREGNLELEQTWAHEVNSLFLFLMSAALVKDQLMPSKQCMKPPN